MNHSTHTRQCNKVYLQCKKDNKIRLRGNILEFSIILHIHVEENVLSKAKIIRWKDFHCCCCYSEADGDNTDYDRS